MLTELHAFKVLFYAESVSVITAGHVTKMAVTPFDPQLPKTPCYTQTLRLYLLQNRSYCPLNFLHCGNKEFRVFLRKIMENIIFPICVAKLMQMMP